MDKMEQSLASQYQKKTDKEHILDNPDTYIGSIENTTDNMYVFKDGKIVQECIDYNPALFKLFDEGIVNCRDHVIRTQMKKTKDPSTDVVTNIHIEIANNRITLTNNGDGIDVEKHPTYDIWIPEMIFGHLRTSTNYNKEEQKITGGKNGFGFKLVLIWSTWGMIETVDAKRGLMYSQVFENNLDKIHQPVIKSCKKKPYTTVSFEPDYKRLGLKNGLTESMISLFQRRVYDIAGVTSKEVKVKYNDEIVPVKDFNHYIGMYTEAVKVSESYDCWSYTVVLGDEFKQISFVNGIFTSKGGKHVEYIVNQIIKKMTALILKKRKIEVKPAVIKEQLTIFLNSTIENPSFDSQTKDFLTTTSSKFGSSCEVSDKFIEKLAGLGVLSAACDMSELKEKKNSKKTDGNKTKNIRGIEKLTDANFAGTKQSNLCTLILCEGDSAKSGIISGLSSQQRDIYGVYPMKGKLLNVRGENIKKINENNEIIEIKKIMGLETGKNYESTDDLRYGKILFMTDQDLEGSHIKGVCINLFECLWPSLLKIDGFLGFMNTPILKATKGNKTLSFYNETEYETWKVDNPSGWKIKYYKGLGTSTDSEFKQYFQDQKVVTFAMGDTDTEKIDMLFNKKKADERKEWLSDYERTSRVDNKTKKVSISEFVDKEMIHFSKYDCDRSIPNMMDGLKVSQRKILYSAFKRNLTQEIKVAQFSGYVSEHSGYHHGEQSLNGAIKGMAQDYVGSNNINLFDPIGQFGSRVKGGKDAASERYIFTRLMPITRMIFNKNDDDILTYLDDDGYKVEPIYYTPIIPMVLVNGCMGIGTGFSTEIPCFNPKTIIEYIMKFLEGKTNDTIDFVPYYKGFKGTIERESEKRFITTGTYSYNKTKNLLEITELPIGTWTEEYIVYLEYLMEDGKKENKPRDIIVKDFRDMSTKDNVHFKITLAKDVTDIVKTFKLSSYLSLNNMNLFNHKEKLTHYDTIHEICDDFIVQRMEYYDKRREHLINILTDKLDILKNKYTYIMELLAETIDLRKKTGVQIHDLLVSKNYRLIDNTYQYLTKMTMDSVSKENVAKLKKQYDDKSKELEIIQNTTIERMWYNDLEELLKMLL
jgi:DNA topoisomerase-2